MNPDRHQRNNLVRCPKCSMSLIDEELFVHECLGDKIVVDIMYDTCGEYYVYDGKKWYRWFPPTEIQQPNKTPDDCNTTRLLVVLR
jgi:hypothetical protein